MIKILTVIGARPQIIKAAAISRVLKTNYAGVIREVLLHTGQHYDPSLSQVFLDELGLPEPDYQLGTGSASHARQTARMMEGIEKVMMEEKPGFILLYGDTNSTLAGALAAAKMNVPVIHVEAGLRSFNKAMPEEINRIVCDHVSTLLFTPTLTGLDNLVREGLNGDGGFPYSADQAGVFHCGDVMYDNTLYFASVADAKTRLLRDLGISPGEYALMTLHRDLNTDHPERLKSIFAAIAGITSGFHLPVVIPMHPRTRKHLQAHPDREVPASLRSNPFLKIISGVSFTEMMALEKNCRLILTDSGGVQKEAYFLKKPCIILRPQTEWTEVLDNGSAVLADADPEKITAAFRKFMDISTLSYPPVFGDGHAAEFICSVILKQHQSLAS